MRILIINTSENNGGAAVASRRLLSALNNNGVKAKMLVRDRGTDNRAVVSVPGRLRQRLHFVWERLVVLCHLHFSRKHLWEIDIANAGIDITRLPEFREADVIHLAWINQGMLSLGSIQKILASGKPVVWTMHDLWPVSAICHYARGCERYRHGCHHCKLLPGGGRKGDLSTAVWQQKKKVYAAGRLHFVACSRWLEDQARKSDLLQGCQLTSIPNPIDTSIFRPREKSAVRKELGLPTDRKIILFAAQKVTDERKGTIYFIQAMKILAERHPQLAERITVGLLGGGSAEVASRLPLATHCFGYVSGEEKIAAVYSAIDLLVLPSMEDNLPNTIMEAMASGAPCVGFNVGGIPEMIDHCVNGFVAKTADAAHLAEGVACVLDADNYTSMSRNAVAKVLNNYSESSVAKKYSAVYSAALKAQQ